ncbi:MAG: hypothetical protein ACI9UA_003280 [Pseudoalteromonas tetraodonis]|jgi:hypothetical protein
MKHLRILLLLLLLPAYLHAKEDLTKRIEIGKVKWGRDLDAALAKSKKTGRPIFILFQEVPG